MKRTACLVLPALILLIPLPCEGGAADEKKANYMANAQMVILSFHQGAIQDFPASLRIQGAPGLWEQWQRRMPGLFDESLHSAAFFSHSLIEVLPRPEGSFIVGYGNIWVGFLVVLKVDAMEKAVNVVDFAVVDVGGGRGGDWRITATDATQLEAVIRQRWETAGETFLRTAQAMAGGTAGEAAEKANGGLPAAEAIARLKEHVTRSREVLSPEAAADRKPLIAALQQVGAQLAGEAAAPAAPPAGLAPIMELPAEWRSALLPNFVLSRADGSAIVVLAATREPGYIVLVDLRPADKGRELNDARLAIMKGSE